MKTIFADDGTGFQRPKKMKHLRVLRVLLMTVLIFTVMGTRAFTVSAEDPPQDPNTNAAQTGNLNDSSKPSLTDGKKNALTLSTQTNDDGSGQGNTDTSGQKEPVIETKQKNKKPDSTDSDVVTTNTLKVSTVESDALSRKATRLTKGVTSTSPVVTDESFGWSSG